ncbi:MAG: Spy/CpxP family protein refolding chaperone [Gammaproteobacteria bacterium]|nr:Spy/CpxP family protein refolding chaperone [Gammaproteobacteria bacterium]
MKHSTKLLLTVAMITGLGAMSAVMPAAAKMDGDRSEHRIERLTNRLDLTDQQSAQIKQLMTQHREANPRLSKTEIKDQMKAQRQQAREQLQAILGASEFDSAAVKQLLAQASEQRQAHIVGQIEIKHGIYQLLNAEQQAKYLKMIGKQMKKMQHHGKRQGKHHGGYDAEH